MKMKKVVAAVTAMTMVAATMLTGCGSKGSSDAFRIGGTGPLTGDASSYGNSVKNGAQLAVDEINAAGGINGVKVEFDYKDDKATAEDASTAYNSLMDWGMVASIGGTTSGSCEAFAASSQEDNLFTITPSASAATVIATGDNVFRVCFGDPDQGVLAADELVKDFDKIGAIYDTSDTYSSGIYEAFKDEMKNLNKEYTEQSFDAENKKDFSTQVEALKDCDVIFLPIYYTEAGLIAKACATKGCNAVLYGCDGFDGIADQIDETVTNEIKYITPFDVNSENEMTANFVAAYEKAYNETPDQFAADGYDAVYAIAKALEASGVKDPSMDPSDICDAIVKALTDASFSLDGATGTMTWDKSGACTKVPQIVELNK